MKAFFYNKITSVVLAIMIMIFPVFITYSTLVCTKKVVKDNKNFFFLVSVEDNVSASAQTAYWYGGAGYILSRGKQEYAVYACYYSEKEIKRVKKNLLDRGIESYIYTENSGKINLMTKKEKNEEENIRGILLTMKETLSLLGKLAIGADTGDYTQREIRDCLIFVTRVLQKVAESSDKKMYSELFVSLLQSSHRISTLSNNIVYSRDIRYEEVFLCDEYLKFVSKFHK